MPAVLIGISSCFEKENVLTIHIPAWKKVCFLWAFFVIIICISVGCFDKWQTDQKITEYFFEETTESINYLEDKFSKKEMDSEQLLRYADYLYLKKEYKRAIPVLGRAMLYSPSSDIACNLGRCYESIEKNEQAIHFYTLSSQMVPGKMTPKYLLFILYDKLLQKEQAREVAREVVKMRVKKEGSRTRAMREKAKGHLIDFE